MSNPLQHLFYATSSTYVNEVRTVGSMPKALPVIDMTDPVCCAPVASTAADDAAALDLALRLKALADPVRVKLLSLLFTCGEPCTTGSLAAAVGLAESTVSHHLGQLRTAGFIASERHGMSVHHSPRREALTALCKVLDPDCC
ncbi:Rv2640c family ArsR-like transcriptional regulator [Tsukamurella strandjordii]|nr:transcriptional regulator [Tsukamurella sp. TY48]